MVLRLPLILGVFLSTDGFYHVGSYCRCRRNSTSSTSSSTSGSTSGSTRHSSSSSSSKKSIVAVVVVVLVMTVMSDSGCTSGWDGIELLVVVAVAVLVKCFVLVLLLPASVVMGAGVVVAVL